MTDDGARIYTGEACPNGHNAGRYAATNACVKCYQGSYEPTKVESPAARERRLVRMREYRRDNYVPKFRPVEDKTTLPTTKDTAIELGAKRYFTGTPCIYGHMAARYTNGGVCCECTRLTHHEVKLGKKLRVVPPMVPVDDPLDGLFDAALPRSRVAESSRFTCDNPLPHIFGAGSARERGLVRYFTGLPCVYGHVSERTVTKNTCVECRNIKSRKKNKKKKPFSELSESQIAKIMAHNRRWKLNNPEKNKENEKRRRRRVQERRELDPLYADRVLTKNREYNSEWGSPSPARDAVKLKWKKPGYDKRQIPAWASLIEMSEIYLESRALSNITGWQNNVDHIIPLKGIVTDGEDSWPVTGLHVQGNLRIVPERDNNKKSNKINIHEIRWLYNCMATRVGP